MADVTMPRLSDTMEEGTIASWLKKPGEQISKGEVIAQIETDKATMDLTAFEAGTLQEILADEGTTVAIGQPVARIGSGKAPPAAKAGAKREAPADADAPPESERNAAGATDANSQRPDAAVERTEATPRSKGEPEIITDAGDAAEAESSDSVKSQTEAAKKNVAEAPEPTPRSAERATAQAAPSGAGDSQSATDDEAAADSQPQAEDGKVRASPMARHIAAERGLDLSSITGSGPQGRVIRSDVEAALAAQQSATSEEQLARAPSVPGDAALSARPKRPTKPIDADDAAEAPAAGAAEATQGRLPRPDGAPPTPGEDDERVPLSQMRRTIARRMAESTRTVPHFFLTTTVDASAMVALRKQILDQTGDSGIKITFNDMVVKGAALAIRSVPDVNVSFAEDALIRHRRIHIGVAVATERGLIVPVLRDVDQKSMGQIARETRDVAQRANAGKLQAAEYTGGTFTISNLGMFGIEQFNAVINTPEAAILAVGAIAREPAEHEGVIALRERLKLTLSVDHRALDGAIGARYLQALKQVLEKPMLLLL